MIIDLLSTAEESFLKKYAYKFKTDCTKFDIKYNITTEYSRNYPQISLNAREEIQVLYKIKDHWNNYNAKANQETISIDLSKEISSEEHVEIIIHPPIVGDLTKLNIEIPQGFDIQINDFQEKILVAGGVHTYGMGINAAGTMFSNIIARKMNLTPYHLSFLDRNFLDKIDNYFVEDKIDCKYEYGILELDYYKQDDFIVDNFLLKTVRHMLKHCNKVICWYTIPRYYKEKQYELFYTLDPLLNGDKLILKDMSFLHDSEFFDRCTSSNNFINDYANILIYKIIKEDMERLQWNI